MPQDYNFLNNYVSNLSTRFQNPDESPLEDDSDLYDVQDEDDQPTQDNGGYGFDEESDDDQQQSDDTSYGYNEDTENDPTGGGSPVAGNLGKSIAGIESGGKYSATNKHSSATGKYQFLWSAWGDSIKKVTGVSSKDEFLHSPKAQEKYYGWYEKHYLMPQVEKLRQYNKAGLSDEQLAKLVHYRGAGGAKKYLQGQMADKQEKYNVPISQYIGTKRLGGGIATSPQAQYEGLNNEQYESMYFPMQGENEFRGLDDGSPVYIEDQYGKKKILRGNSHRAIMKGDVYERRMQAGGENNIKQFYYNYMNSPNYTNRLKQMGYSNPKDTIKDRENQLRKTDVINYPDWINGSEFIPDINRVFYDPSQSERQGFTKDLVEAHEFSHAAGAMGNYYNQSKLNNLTLNKKEISTLDQKNKYFEVNPSDPNMIHDEAANELKADIDSLRYKLKKDKIYDTGTQKFNIQHLNKAKKKYSKNPELKRIFDRVNDRDLIYLMNSIASNELSTQNVS